MATDLANKIIDIAEEMQAKETADKQIKLELVIVNYDHDKQAYIDHKYACILENLDKNRIKIIYKSLNWIHYKNNKETNELIIIILRQKITQMLKETKMPCLNENRIDVNILHKDECIFTQTIYITIPIEYEDLKYVHKYDCNNNINLLDLQTLYLTYFKLAASANIQTVDS